MYALILLYYYKQPTFFYLFVVYHLINLYLNFISISKILASKFICQQPPIRGKQWEARLQIQSIHRICDKEIQKRSVEKGKFAQCQHIYWLYPTILTRPF